MIAAQHCIENPHCNCTGSPRQMQHTNIQYMLCNFKAMSQLPPKLKNNTLTTYRVKKLTPERKSIIRNSNIDSRNLRVGIVIQGQVIPTLTFRICERYKSLYPNANIVVSTWENQQTGDLEKIQQLGIYLIENEIPGFSGPGNINLQIASTKAGIEFCKEKNSDYILKNRSDTWLSSDYFLEYLSYMHETFASANNKIIIPSYNSFLFRLYSPTDQIQFVLP